MALSAEDLILGIMDFAARSEMPVRYRDDMHPASQCWVPPAPMGGPA